MMNMLLFTGEAEVQVRITDKNDNAPFFKHRQYNATVPENTDVGAVIMTVTSEDEDDGRLSLWAVKVTFSRDI